MKKPYRGDYKPDYEKWEQIRNNETKIGFIDCLFVSYAFRIIVIVLLSFLFDYPYDWESFSFIYDIVLNFGSYFNTFLWGIGVYIFLKFIPKSASYKESIRQLAEQEAENKYKEDLDRYYHYMDADDEIDDRKMARELKRKRTFGELDNQQLLGLYANLASIQHQSNQQAYLFFEEAQRALRKQDTYNVENALDNLERSLGV